MSHTLQGSDLRKWREAQGLTQEEAARKLGYAREWLSKIENGKVPVSSDLYLKLESLKREENLTTRGAPVMGVEEDPAPYGTADSLRKEIRRRVEDTIGIAGDDVGKLGWIREQVIRYASPPEHWDVHEQVIKKVLAEEQAAARRTQSPPDAQGKSA